MSIPWFSVISDEAKRMFMENKGINGLPMATNAVSIEIQGLSMEIHVSPMQIHRYYMHIHENLGLQDIDFPRCTIISQDLKDSGLLIFQEALIFQKWIFRTVLRFQDSCNIIQKTSNAFFENMSDFIELTQVLRLS